LIFVSSQRVKSFLSWLSVTLKTGFTYSCISKFALFIISRPFTVNLKEYFQILASFDKSNSQAKLELLSSFTSTDFIVL
jgi:hypothetical protein